MKTERCGKKKCCWRLGEKYDFFVSYRTIVAFRSKHGLVYATKEKFSVTTSKQMTQCLSGVSSLSWLEPGAFKAALREAMDVEFSGEESYPSSESRILSFE